MGGPPPTHSQLVAGKHDMAARPRPPAAPSPALRRRCPHARTRAPCRRGAVLTLLPRLHTGRALRRTHILLRCQPSHRGSGGGSGGGGGIAAQDRHSTDPRPPVHLQLCAPCPCPVQQKIDKHRQGCVARIPATGSESWCAGCLARHCWARLFRRRRCRCRCRCHCHAAVSCPPGLAVRAEVRGASPGVQPARWCLQVSQRQW
jgi:hypothetical protein